MKVQMSALMKAALRSSAELNSAVSQICNLRRRRLAKALRNGERSAECNSAIRQIENLRYFGARQALLHCQSSGAAHRPAFTGLFTT